MKFDFNDVEVKELKAALAGRLRELDKAMKSALKAEVTSAAENVMSTVNVVRNIISTIKETEK